MYFPARELTYTLILTSTYSASVKAVVYVMWRFYYNAVRLGATMILILKAVP